MTNERLKAIGITQTELAERLGLTPAAVSMKLNGHRPWKRDEIDAALALCREKDPTLTYERLFGSAADASTPEAATA